MTHFLFVVEFGLALVSISSDEAFMPLNRAAAGWILGPDE